MAIFTIQTDSLPSYSESVCLEGSNYTIQFDFNQRCAEWYMSIADQDGVDIYNGVKIVCNMPLLRKCKDDRRPGFQSGSPYAGDFLCTSSLIGNQYPPSQLDLLPNSGRCALSYITSDWMALLATGQGSAILAQIAAGGTLTSPISPYGQS